MSEAELVDAILECGRPVKIGQFVMVRPPVTKFDPHAPFDPFGRILPAAEPVVITPELWARIEARR